MNAIDASLLLGSSLEREAERMRAFAHQPEHYIRVFEGAHGPAEHVERLYRDTLVYRQKQEGWETRIRYTYSVDVLANGRAVRHLCVQISVPGQITQGEINLVKDHLAAQMDGIAKTFFPLDTDVGFVARALAPIPVVDNTGERNVHFRTPVGFHFTADHGHVDVGAMAAPEREYLASEVVEGIDLLIQGLAQDLGVSNQPDDDYRTLRTLRERITRGDWKKMVADRP